MNRRPLILIALLLAAFVINLDTTIVNNSATRISGLRFMAPPQSG